MVSEPFPPQIYMADNHHWMSHHVWLSGAIHFQDPESVDWVEASHPDVTFRIKKYKYTLFWIIGMIYYTYSISSLIRKKNTKIPLTLHSSTVGSMISPLHVSKWLPWMVGVSATLHNSCSMVPMPSRGWSSFQGSLGSRKTGKVREFKRRIPCPGKVHELDKYGKSQGKRTHNKYSPRNKSPVGQSLQKKPGLSTTKPHIYSTCKPICWQKNWRPSWWGSKGKGEFSRM